MTDDRDLDRRLEDYLQAGPAELSDHVLWAARSQIRTTRRRARFIRLVSWRATPMKKSLRLLLAAAGVLAVVAIGFSVLAPRPSGPGSSPPSGPTSSRAPSGSASAPASAAVSAKPTPSPTFIPPVVPLGSVTTKAAAWGVTGAPATSFGTPVLAPDGAIWVPANELDRIRIYDENGKLKETWGTPGSKDGQFRFGNSADPDRAGIVFAPDGTFFVLDSGNGRVERFSADRQFVSAFGSSGSGDGQFVSPVAIGLDDGPNLYVGDAGRNDVQVFTIDGTYVRTIAKGAAGNAIWGSGPGWFITTSTTDDGPGAIEWHSDGTVQGGWDLSPWGCEPAGVTRDQAPRNIYITCTGATRSGDYLFRFDQSGTLLHAWRANGVGVAVTPGGTRAFTVSLDGMSLSRWDLEPPAGG